MNTQININISQEAYDKYRQKNNAISNTRLRPDGETFFEAMMSVDMTSTPEGREILETIKELN